MALLCILSSFEENRMVCGGSWLASVSKSTRLSTARTSWLCKTYTLVSYTHEPNGMILTSKLLSKLPLIIVFEFERTKLSSIFLLHYHPAQLIIPTHSAKTKTKLLQDRIKKIVPLHFKKLLSELRSDGDGVKNTPPILG